MDMEQIKHLIALARKNGVRRLNANGVEIEMHDAVELLPKPRRPRRVDAQAQSSGITVEKDTPTLDQINRFIYDSAEDIA